MIDHHRKFIFIHVPRTGGHSAYKMLGYKMLGYKMLGYKLEPPGPIHRPRCEADANYFSFGFIRNPWDRMYSCYRRQKDYKKIKGKSFKYYLLEGLADNDVRHCAMWYLNGCDYIGRYEKLQTEWNYLLPKIGLPAQVVPKVNQYGNPEYRYHYDSELIDYIADKHAEDIEYGGYAFD